MHLTNRLLASGENGGVPQKIHNLGTAKLYFLRALGLAPTNRSFDYEVILQRENKNFIFSDATFAIETKTSSLLVPEVQQYAKNVCCKPAFHVG
jgi:hypothetical protein